MDIVLYSTKAHHPSSRACFRNKPKTSVKGCSHLPVSFFKRQSHSLTKTNNRKVRIDHQTRSMVRCFVDKSMIRCFNETGALHNRFRIGEAGAMGRCEASFRDIPMGYGVPSPITKGLGGDLEARRGLVPLVFVAINPGDDIPDN